MSQSISIRDLFTKRYDAQHYHCAHFVADAYKTLTGNDISDKLQGFLLPLRDRKPDLLLKREFKKLDKPEDLTIVGFSSPRVSPHVGLYYKNNVMHLTEYGAHNVPLDIARVGFSQVRFYQCL